jgi:hypothetical protein
MILALIFSGASKAPSLDAAATLTAALAQIAFALSAAFALVTRSSAAGSPIPNPIPLRNLATTAAAIVTIQMLLGVAFRHQLAPFWLHIAGSFLAAGVMLMGALTIFDNYAEHPRLRLYGPWILGITLGQLSLGLAAYTMRVIQHPAVHFTAAAHAALGAITLAASLSLALEAMA